MRYSFTIPVGFFVDAEVDWIDACKYKMDFEE